ncbi:MAG TPA: LysR family transcriptional regulator [Burkholderiaceae bacterium]|nr:LysR family transcriptional regulator [Burkholderiaceae bacterium]
MNLKHLQSFVRVAELGSFSKAARVLDIAQPALSRQVRQLETDLRETLLLRNGRGVSLTDAGRRLFDHGVQILQQVEQAREDLGAERGAAVGHVTIGMPPSIGRRLTLPLIEGFRQQLPRARLTIVEGLSANIAEWITSGRADLGLLYNPEAQRELELTPLLREPLCLVEPAATRPRRAAPRPLPLRELSAYPLILPERHQSIRRLLQSQATLAGVKLDIAWEVSSVPAIIDLVCARVGHAVLTASAVQASGRSSELAVRPIVEPELVSVLFLAQSATKPPTPLTRRVGRLLTELIEAPAATVAKAPR